MTSTCFEYIFFFFCRKKLSWTEKGAREWVLYFIGATYARIDWNSIFPTFSVLQLTEFPIKLFIVSNLNVYMLKFYFNVAVYFHQLTLKKLFAPLETTLVTLVAKRTRKIISGQIPFRLFSKKAAQANREKKSSNMCPLE